MFKKMLFAVALGGSLFCVVPASAQMAAPAMDSSAKPPVAAKPAPAPAPATKMQKTDLLDINSASEEELRGLKGVGDVRAKAIIAGRPYKGKDELVQKSILPKGVYNGIKNQIIAKQK